MRPALKVTAKKDEMMRDPVLKVNFDPSDRDKAVVILAELQKYAEKLNVTADLEPTLAALEEHSAMLRRRMLEMALLEFVAFNSDEPTIISARKKLFMAAKLVHGEYIQEALQDDIFKEVFKGRQSNYMDTFEKQSEDSPFSSKNYKESKHWTLRGLRERLNIKRNAKTLWEHYAKKRVPEANGPETLNQSVEEGSR